MSALHSCQNCGYVTDILSHMLPAFEENPHCRQCGLSISESDAKMQDDLAALMSRNLTLVQPTEQAASTPPTPQVLPQCAPITYASAHYTHSAHLASATVNAQASVILERHGVNAAALFPSQLHLFRNAPSEQQQRLIELWTIAPPTYGNQMSTSNLTNWPQTSMEQEEVAARERWEKQEQQRSKDLDMSSSQDGGQAEPYMATGYRHSTDPAYNGREWWNLAPDQPMEYQYGMLQQLMQYDSP